MKLSSSIFWDNHSDENKMFRESENHKITNYLIENLDDSEMFISEYMFQNNWAQLINNGTLTIAPCI